MLIMLAFGQQSLQAKSHSFQWDLPTSVVKESEARLPLYMKKAASLQSFPELMAAKQHLLHCESDV